MPRSLTTLLALATLSAAAPLLAQDAAPSAYLADGASTGPSYSENYTQPPAPIERAYMTGGQQQHAPSPDNYRPPQQDNYRPPQQAQAQNHTSQPAQGIWVVSGQNASVQTVSATADHTELRVEHGQANVNIHHPADNSEITVDLPGGQVSLVKDGLYTFNADTNTVRTLRGEAVIATAKDHEIKVKEEHQFSFGPNAHSQEASRDQLRADLLQGNYGGEGGYRHGDGYGSGYGSYGSPYAYGPYGWPSYGFYGPGWGSPYYAYGPWGSPFGYGYGVGLGFGYYGGFRGGYGYRGGFGGIRGGLRR